MGAIRFVQVGLGPLGRKIVRFACERAGFTLVGAVDADPRKVGADAGELCELAPLGIPVKESIEEAAAGAAADVAILATVSDIASISPQVRRIIACGLPVVTTCEELSYPWEAAPEAAREIDAAARKAGVAVLATGVNPGFLMDSLPIALTAACQRVDRVRVARIQDAAYRRVPFQRKIGAGLSLEEFEEKRRAGTLRHVGLAQSMHMIASRMGWRLTRVEDVISPVVARRRIAAGELTVEPGRAAGVQQVGRAFCGDVERVTLEFRAAVGEPDPRDEVEIFGEPSLRSTIAGGVNGDVATCAITLNAVPRVLAAGPGLRTMVDVPVVSFFQ